MKNYLKRSQASRSLSLLLAISLILISVTSLFSCVKLPSESLTREEILANMEERDGGFSSVHEYLDDWGIRGFSSMKMSGVELAYKNYYYKDLPAPKEFAKSVAMLYLDNCLESTDPADSTAVTDALISCFVAATEDRYAAYRTASEYSDYVTDMSGSFVGIGITVQYIEEEIVIIKIIDDSPAEEAGIQVGDIVLAVDGVSVREAGYDASINSIRGEEGTAVTLTLDRDGEAVTVVATRRPVVEPTVEYELNDGVGYILITSFKDNTAEQFIAAVDYMEKNGAKGLIFDLRTNTGGYLSAVGKMVGYLVPEGTVIASFSNDYAPDLVAEGSHTLSLPCVILTNEYTASASELFTAALLDYEKMGLIECTTVGKTTYGKGVMQSTLTFTDKSALTLTVAYYNSPLGKNHDGVGLTPDVEAEYSPEHDGQLEAAYTEIAKLIG
ncbi:MAG: PDZ domain-containing protein [Clostridia bacterium]|nr:PDZ domain-containing protein [Clostridia bacterium]